MNKPSDAGRPQPVPDVAALAELFKNLAHHLRSPLGVVSGALTELGLAGASEEDRLLLSLADRGVRRLRRVADTIALAAALDSGAFELRCQRVDLGDLLRGAVATAVAVEPRREVELACDVPAEPCPVLADVEPLARAVSEVLINAIQHARRAVRLRLEVAESTARAVIEDDGQGVPEDRRETLFRRFAPRPSRAGMGIALSIAHDVIVAHGGGVTVETGTLPPGRPGTVGARFVISLPIDLGA